MTKRPQITRFRMKWNVQKVQEIELAMTHDEAVGRLVNDTEGLISELVHLGEVVHEEERYYISEEDRETEVEVIEPDLATVIEFKRRER